MQQQTTNAAMIQQKLQEAKRVVVKVGSSSLTHANGKLNLNSIELLARQLADLKNAGRQVLLVSSGAVAAGMGKLDLPQKPSVIAEKQALAAIGQGILMQYYEKVFGEYGANVAQVLLTKDDIAIRDRYLNARNTFNALFAYGVVPIINENDTVTVDEIKVGDNDTLAALVAGLVEADLLILLSDIDGLYTANPRQDPGAKRIDIIEEITPEVEEMAGDAGSSLGTGGMCTKIQAAKIACSCGTPMVLTNAAIPKVLLSIMQGHANGTVFLPLAKHLAGKKGWLAYGAKSKGIILVDDGAAKALTKAGSSLLPTGIVDVRGVFFKGDIVAVCAASKPSKEIAKGFVNYSSHQVEAMKGCHSNEIRQKLPTLPDDELEPEVIHRDYLSLKL